MPAETFAATLRRLIPPANLDTPDVYEWTFDSAIHAREQLRDFLEGHADTLAELVEAANKVSDAKADMLDRVSGVQELRAALRRLEERCS